MISNCNTFAVVQILFYLIHYSRVKPAHPKYIKYLSVVNQLSKSYEQRPMRGNNFDAWNPHWRLSTTRVGVGLPRVGVVPSCAFRPLRWLHKSETAQHLTATIPTAINTTLANVQIVGSVWPIHTYRKYSHINVGLFQTQADVFCPRN